LLGSAGQANYAASKAGLVGLARSLARELGSRNITANVVAPGFVDTDMTAVLSDDRKAAILGQVPLGRLATADEVAATVAFLAQPGGAHRQAAARPAARHRARRDGPGPSRVAGGAGLRSPGRPGRRGAQHRQRAAGRARR